MVGFGQPETAGMTEPQADRFLRRTVWELVRSARAILPGLCCRPRRSFLEPGPGGRGLLPRPTLGDHGLDTAALGRGAAGIAATRSLVLARIAAPLSAIGLTLVHGLFWTDMYADPLSRPSR